MDEFQLQFSLLVEHGTPIWHARHFLKHKRVSQNYQVVADTVVYNIYQSPFKVRDELGGVVNVASHFLVCGCQWSGYIVTDKINGETPELSLRVYQFGIHSTNFARNLLLGGVPYLEI